MEASGIEFLGYVFLFAFGLCSLGMGVVTAKYGSGVSRTIGLITAGVGIVFLVIFAVVADGAGEILKFSIVTGLGAGIGAILGLGLFLLSIMKS